MGGHDRLAQRAVQGGGPVIVLALLLLAVALAPALPHALAADRHHRRYLRVKAKYQRNLGRLAQPVLQSNLESRTAR